MKPLPPGRATDLLRRWRGGDEAALGELMSMVYSELHGMAGAYLARERSDHTLQATALVHEAYLKLVDAKVDWQDRVHFLAVAARIMRQVLVDHGRARRSLKRGGGRVRTTLIDADERSPGAEVDVVDLHQALEQLADLDSRKSRIVELHYFGGLTYEEAGQVLALSPATVKRELRFAKA